MTKLFAFIFTVFLSWSALSQKRVIAVLDSDEKSPLEDVNVTLSEASFYKTDEKGKVSLAGDSDDTVRFSRVGYLTFQTAFGDVTDTVYLPKSTDELEQVVVSPKNIGILKPRKALGNLNPRNYGGGGAPLKDEIYALFVPNSIGKELLLRSVSVEPTDYSLKNLAENTSEKQKGQKFAPFKLSIYSVDPTYGIPGKSLIAQEVTVQLSGGQRFATARFDEGISIGTEGFFIVLTPFSSSYYQEIGFVSAPAFNTIQASEDTPQLFLTRNTRAEESIWRQTGRNRDYNEVLSYRIEVAY